MKLRPHRLLLIYHRAMTQAPFAIKVVWFSDCYEYDAVCPWDSVHFNSAEEWKSHHLEHHIDTMWRCPFCDKENSSWPNYSFHVQIAEHNSVCLPPWICTMEHKKKSFGGKSGNSWRCDRRFGSKYQFKRHIRSRHADYQVPFDIMHIPRGSGTRRFSTNDLKETNTDSQLTVKFSTHAECDAMRSLQQDNTAATCTHYISYFGFLVICGAI